MNAGTHGYFLEFLPYLAEEFEDGRGFVYERFPTRESAMRRLADLQQRGLVEDADLYVERLPGQPEMRGTPVAAIRDGNWAE